MTSLREINETSDETNRPEKASAPVGDDHTIDSPAELIRNHQAGVWRYLRFLGAAVHQVDDLVQETFLEVLRSQDKGTFQQRSRGETASYLRFVARNKLFATNRKQGNRPLQFSLETAQATAAFEEQEAVWSNVAGADGLEDYLAALRDCLSVMTDRAGQAIKLFYTDRLSREEVAERLDMKPAGIKTLLRRSRQSLRDCIDRKVKS